MELIDIVDETGKKTGEIMDKDEVHNKNLFHNEVGVFLINDKKQILLEKRSSNKRYSPNKWGLCAGHVDSGESLKQAALRELKEEVGIDLKESDLISFGNPEKLIDKTNSHFTHFYYSICNKEEKEFTIQEEELSEVRWFNFNEVIDLIKSDNNSTTFNEKRIYLFELLEDLY